MQILFLQPNENGNYYPNFDEMIKNASDEDERNYLIEVKGRRKKWAEKGFTDKGFAFGLIYTARQACGHYEIFQHPVYSKYGMQPIQEDMLKSVEDVVETIHINIGEKRKCTACICGWNKKEV